MIQQNFAGTSSAGSGNYSSDGFGLQLTKNYATNAQGLYQDPNPQIIRRPAARGVQTYTQRVLVKFLQPPPVPPPGVSISSNINL